MRNSSSNNPLFAIIIFFSKNFLQTSCKVNSDFFRTHRKPKLQECSLPEFYIDEMHIEASLTEYSLTDGFLYLLPHIQQVLEPKLKTNKGFYEKTIYEL